MKRIWLLIVFLIPMLMHAQVYEELTDTKPIDNALWEKQKEGVCVSWGSTNTRYSKTNVPRIKIETKKRVHGWKGEKLNAVIAIWNKSSDCDISVESTDLKFSAGNIISKKNISIGIVRYVMTDEFIREGKTSCGFRKNKAEWDSSLVADIIDTKQYVFLKERNTTSIWLNIQIPYDAAKGLYKGEIIVRKNGEVSHTLKLEVGVGGYTLPHPKEWKFHLDLWQNPYSVARFHRVDVWSNEHMRLLKEVMKPLADAGQKVITASIMHKPWNGQTYDYFESMVTWIRKLNGSWVFNYDIFDKWVELMMSIGIDKQINCYSMVPWNFSFKYFDERTNDMAILKTKPGEKAYNDVWYVFLSDFAKHLKEKGWFDKTCIAMDERPLEVMKTVIALIHRADPQYKIALAGQYYPEIEKDLYDYCVSMDQTIPKEVVERRAAENLVTTYYTYCADFKPNVFTFSDPAEATWIPLFVEKLGFSGYLRWAYNSWGENPLQDSRFRQWPAGDTHYVYPGFRSSIRFEKTIEGIQQFEKIQVLKKEYAKNKGVLRDIQKEMDGFKAEDVFKSGNAAKVTEKMMRYLNRF